MKKLFILLLAWMTTMSWARQSSVTIGSDGKSWTLSTNSFVYQIRVSNQGTVHMFYFGDKNQDLKMIHHP